MDDAHRYNIEDAKRQAVFDHFSGQKDKADLSAEISAARLLLQEMINSNSPGATIQLLSVISRLSKGLVEWEEAAHLTIKKEAALQFVSGFQHVVSTVLKDLLPRDLFHEVSDEIVRRIKAMPPEQLLLEGPNDDQ